MTNSQKIEMYYKLITRDSVQALNKYHSKKMDLIEFLDIYSMQYARFLDMCNLVSEGRTPKQDELIGICERAVDDMRDILVSYL